MIIRASRGYVRFSVAGREITVSGEQCYPPGAPGFFVAFEKTLQKWDDGRPVAPAEIGSIKATLEEDFRKAGGILVWG